MEKQQELTEAVKNAFGLDPEDLGGTEEMMEDAGRFTSTQEYLDWLSDKYDLIFLIKN